MGAMWLGLGQFLASLFGKNMAFFVAQWNGKLLFRQAQIVLLIAMMVALYSAVTGILGTIFMSLPDILSIPLSWVAPSNLNSLIVAYISFRIALALYRWKHTQIKRMY